MRFEPASSFFSQSERIEPISPEARHPFFVSQHTVRDETP